MAKKAVWQEVIHGYAVVILGGNGKDFIAFASDTLQPISHRAFYRKRADAVRAKREELRQFKTRIEKATLTLGRPGRP